MNAKNIHLGNTTQKIVFLIGCLCLFFVIALDNSYWSRQIFQEGVPNWTIHYNLRSIIIFFSTAAVLWSLMGSRRPKLVLSESNGISTERGSIFVVLFISVILLVLFIFQPAVFNALSNEDNLIEWGSALLLFGSCFIAAFSSIKYKHTLNNSKAIKVSLSLLSFVFFIIAMEEISWFQRVFEIKTPEMFEGSSQNEMNLHNFATDYIENLYYFATFVFLVALPFMRSLFPLISNNTYLKIFVARPFIGVIGSIAFAYNFDMWNILFTQITFFGSLMILGAFAFFSSVKNERYIILFTIVLIVTTQILFLVNGIKFDRLWQVTEYKEFFIPLALFIYSCDVFIHIQRLFLLEKIE
jgi:hypothetical protein